jgi:hypothetical protein
MGYPEDGIFAIRRDIKNKEDSETLLAHDSPQFACRDLKRQRYKHLRIGLLLGLLLTSLLASLAVWTSETRQGPPPLPSIPAGIDPISNEPAAWFNGDCGNSSTQAMSRGCTFDILSFAWLPPACHTSEDHKDGEEFINLHPWIFEYPDGREVGVDELRKGEHSLVFTSWEWHFAHCTFLWRRLHRKVGKGEKVDTYIGGLGHTEHCMKEVLQALESGHDTGTRVWTKFPRCR